jgi:hypothetical protein
MDGHGCYSTPISSKAFKRHPVSLPFEFLRFSMRKNISSLRKVRSKTIHSLNPRSSEARWSSQCLHRPVELEWWWSWLLGSKTQLTVIVLQWRDSWLLFPYYLLYFLSVLQWVCIPFRENGYKNHEEPWTFILSFILIKEQTYLIWHIKHVTYKIVTILKTGCWSTCIFCPITVFAQLMMRSAWSQALLGPLHALVGGALSKVVC